MIIPFVLSSAHETYKVKAEIKVIPLDRACGIYAELQEDERGRRRSKRGDGAVLGAQENPVIAANSNLAVPGALFTYAAGISPSGAVAGYYADASFTIHGFLRTKDGTITTIDPPESKGTTLTNAPSD